jgi:hypothetical protein
MKLYQDLIIDEGGELTIGCHLVMHQDVKIIVKPGGTLIVDGAVIGTDIYEKRMWQGIEVWGNSSESQYHFQDGFRQGYLELKNGAVVENAVCAIELWHPGHWNTTGGIVYANDAVFRNNAKTVHALHYTNYHPANNLELTYNSYFDNCEFIIDTNYLGTETFNKHVDLDHVNGILFRGCDFSTNRSVPGVSQQCIGIGAYSAGFTIDSNCESNVSPCPTNSIDHCTFTGFKNGITVTNDGTGTRSFCVRDAVFTNNDRGIYAQNSGFATILNNEFCVGGTADCSYGVYAEGVSGFCIEENSFRPVEGSIGTTYGIGIYNSLGANDIYLNSFGELSCGNLAYGINTAGDGSPFGTGLSGLTYTCNNNSGNAIDFCVLKDNGRGGIHDIQGSLSLPAGNTFSGSMYHFYNDGSDTIHYYYKSGASGQSPLSSKTYRVATQSTTNTNGCNSHYGGGVIKSPEEKKALAHAYHIADSMYTVLKSIYDKIKDDDVTYLISQMARYAHERCLAAGDIVRSDLNDTVIDLTELRLWLGNMKDLASDRLIVSTYIHEGDFTSAIALANTFPATYSLQSDDLSEHYEYMTLLDLYRTLYDSGRNIHELTEDEMKVVSDIAVNGHGTSKLMAGSIMTDIPNRDVMSFICPDLPRVKDGRDMNAISDNTADETDAFALGIVPNPATNWVTIDYVLPDKEFKATMTIINSLGVRVMSVVLDNCQGTKTINLSDVPAGVYGYTVKCGEYQKTGKLVINK